MGLEYESPEAAERRRIADLLESEGARSIIADELRRWLRTGQGTPLEHAAAKAAAGLAIALLVHPPERRRRPRVGDVRPDGFRLVGWRVKFEDEEAGRWHSAISGRGVIDSLGWARSLRLGEGGDRIVRVWRRPRRKP